MPFPADLARTPIDVLADKYVDLHSPVQVWNSIISAQVSVPAAVKTLAELLFAVETTETDEVIEESLTDVLEYSGTLAPHAHMNILAGSCDITFQRSAAPVVLLDQGDGTLVVGADVGTINYLTGAWTITLDSTPDNADDITATYDWGYVVAPTSTPYALWLSPGVVTEIYATYSADGTPSATEGILLAEAIFLHGQPNLIANAKFFGATTLMDVEVLV